MEDIGHYFSGEIHDDDNFMVFINGQVVGLISNPNTFVNELRVMRRRGKIGESISISLNYERRSVSIDTDDGRIARPLIIVENGVPKVGL